MIPKKKCLNPDCMAIYVTNDVRCKYCGKYTMTDAESKKMSGIRTTLIRRDQYGNEIYRHPEIDKIKIKGNGGGKKSCYL